MDRIEDTLKNVGARFVNTITRSAKLSNQGFYVLFAHHFASPAISPLAYMDETPVAPVRKDSKISLLNFGMIKWNVWIQEAE